MEGKDISKLRVASLTGDSYFTQSQDMEVVLRWQCLWKYIENRNTRISGIHKEQDNEHHADDPDDELNDINEKKVQECDLALAYIMTTISQKCEVAVCKIGCPAEACTNLKMMLQAMSKDASDAKLSTLQNIS